MMHKSIIGFYSNIMKVVRKVGLFSLQAIEWLFGGPLLSYLSFRPIGRGYTKQYINSSKLAQGLKVPPMTLGSKLKRGTVKNSSNLRPGGVFVPYMRKCTKKHFYALFGGHFGPFGRGGQKGPFWRLFT